MTANWFQLAVQITQDAWATAQVNRIVRAKEDRDRLLPPKDIVQAIRDGAWKGEA